MFYFQSVRERGVVHALDFGCIVDLLVSQCPRLCKVVLSSAKVEPQSSCGIWISNACGERKRSRFFSRSIMAWTAGSGMAALGPSVTIADWWVTSMAVI